VAARNVTRGLTPQSRKQERDHEHQLLPRFLVADRAGRFDSEPVPGMVSTTPSGSASVTGAPLASSSRFGSGLAAAAINLAPVDHGTTADREPSRSTPRDDIERGEQSGECRIGGTPQNSCRVRPPSAAFTWSSTPLS